MTKKEGGNTLSLLQFVEITTDQPDVVRELQYEWECETRDMRIDRKFQFTIDRDRPDTYLAVIEFDDFESALIHAEMPQTQRLYERIAELSGKPPRIRNFTIIHSEYNPPDKAVRVA